MEVIRKDHPNWQVMYNRWNHERGSELHFRGKLYDVLQDGDEKAFREKEPKDQFAYYGHVSVKR